MKFGGFGARARGPDKSSGSQGVCSKGPVQNFLETREAFCALAKLLGSFDMFFARAAGISLSLCCEILTEKTLLRPKTFNTTRQFDHIEKLDHLVKR